MASLSISYLGEMRCEVVHESSGSVLQTEAAKEDLGRGETFSPTDLLATSLATCVLTTMVTLARRLEVDMTGATAKIEKVMGTGTPRRVVALPLTISIPALPSEINRLKLERAAHACPVHHSLHPAIEKPITILWGTNLQPNA